MQVFFLDEVQDVVFAWYLQLLQGGVYVWTQPNGFCIEVAQLQFVVDMLLHCVCYLYACQQGKVLVILLSLEMILSSQDCDCIYW